MAPDFFSLCCKFALTAQSLIHTFCFYIFTFVRICLLRLARPFAAGAPEFPHWGIIKVISILFYSVKSSPSSSSEHLSSFVCSEVRHVDWDLIKNPKQMSDSGGGKQVEKGNKKLKVFQAIAETIQLPCLSNLASQVIVSNCLTKIDTSVATV